MPPVAARGKKQNEDFGSGPAAPDGRDLPQSDSLKQYLQERSQGEEELGCGGKCGKCANKCAAGALKDIREKLGNGENPDPADYEVLKKYIPGIESKIQQIANGKLDARNALLGKLDAASSKIIVDTIKTEIADLSKQLQSGQISNEVYQKKLSTVQNLIAEVTADKISPDIQRSIFDLNQVASKSGFEPVQVVPRPIENTDDKLHSIANPRRNIDPVLDVNKDIQKQAAELQKALLSGNVSDPAVASKVAELQSKLSTTPAQSLTQATQDLVAKLNQALTPETKLEVRATVDPSAKPIAPALSSTAAVAKDSTVRTATEVQLRPVETRVPATLTAIDNRVAAPEQRSVTESRRTEYVSPTQNTRSSYAQAVEVSNARSAQESRVVSDIRSPQQATSVATSVAREFAPIANQKSPAVSVENQRIITRETEGIRVVANNPQNLNNSIGRLEALAANSRLGSELAARQFRDIARELERQPRNIPTSSLERLSDLLARSNRQNQPTQPDQIRLERQVNNLLLNRQLDNIEKILNSNNLSTQLSSKQLAGLLARLDPERLTRAPTVLLERLNDLLARSRNVNNIQSDPNLIRLQRQVTNILLNRQLNNIDKILAANPSTALTPKQITELMKLLAGSTRNTLGAENLERLTKLLQRLEQGLGADRNKNLKGPATDLDRLAQQIRNLLSQRPQESQRIVNPSVLASYNRDTNLLAQLRNKEQLILNRIGQLRETLKLQQQYEKQLGNKLSPADRLLLKKQELILLKRIDRLENKLSINQKLQANVGLRIDAQVNRQVLLTRSAVRSLLNEMNKNGLIQNNPALKEQLNLKLAELMSKLAQKDVGTDTSLLRLRRLEQISLMLQEGQELSARMLQELQELLSDELEDGAGQKTGRRTSRRVSKKNLLNKAAGQEAGAGLMLEEGKALANKSAAPAKTTQGRVTTNAKTGNMIKASTSMPSRSLDVVQSKEDDGEKNQYWKEVNGE